MLPRSSLLRGFRNSVRARALHTRRTSTAATATVAATKPLTLRGRLGAFGAPSAAAPASALSTASGGASCSGAWSDAWSTRTPEGSSKFWSGASPFAYSRTYRGPLQAAILDWSGTTADNWVIAPAYAFVEVFAHFGVPITMEQARGPMGLRKDLHIRALTEEPAVRAAWRAKHGRDPTQHDVDAMFAQFVPMQLKCLPRYTGLIDGTAETVNVLRNRFGLKIGATTGFQRVMVDVLLRDAAKQGFVPDVAVAGDEASAPRPYPYMVWRNLELLGVASVASVLKVDDTVGGIGEGLNAGAWTCALSHTSNYMNINSEAERAAMSDEEFAARGAKSREHLLKSGAHYVVDDIRGLPGVVQDINKRLARGEKP